APPPHLLPGPGPRLDTLGALPRAHQPGAGVPEPHGGGRGLRPGDARGGRGAGARRVPERGDRVMRGGTVATVARREIRGYFDQPTAYVLVVAFLGLSLFLAFRSMYAMGVASLRPLFDLLPMLFAVFVPAATMRALAEERRSRTLDWLVAQPL